MGPTGALCKGLRAIKGQCKILQLGREEQPHASTEIEGLLARKQLCKEEFGRRAQHQVDHEPATQTLVVKAANQPPGLH